MSNRAQRSGGERSVIVTIPSPVVGWIYRFSVTNHWKVSGFYELDDLCQDGLLCAVRCRNRYGTPGVDIEHPHFMSLVQTTFSRYLIDLTRKYACVGDPIYLADLGTDEIAVRERYSPAEHPLGELARCVEELPDYLYRLIRTLLTDPGLRVKRRDEYDLRRFFCDC